MPRYILARSMRKRGLLRQLRRSRDHDVGLGVIHPFFGKVGTFASQLKSGPLEKGIIFIFGHTQSPYAQRRGRSLRRESLRCNFCGNRNHRILGPVEMLGFPIKDRNIHTLMAFEPSFIMFGTSSKILSRSR